MSPTIFRAKGLRFFFFSREEPRIHVHIRGEDGAAKVWIEPEIEIARNDGLSWVDLSAALNLIWEREDEIREAWRQHFGS
jgi:8-oxo-dGTP pyrophosphatase MutT (NUDIX family)